VPYFKTCLTCRLFCRKTHSRQMMSPFTDASVLSVQNNSRLKQNVGLWLLLGGANFDINLITRLYLVNRLSQMCSEQNNIEVCQSHITQIGAGVAASTRFWRWGQSNMWTVKHSVSVFWPPILCDACESYFLLTTPGSNLSTAARRLNARVKLSSHIWRHCSALIAINNWQVRWTS